MLSGSVFFWVFIGSSLVLCTVFLEEYRVHPQIGRLVLGGSLLASFAVSIGLTLAARRFAAPRILGSMTAGSYSESRLETMFAKLCGQMGMRGVELREARMGNAFSVDVKGSRVVAVSPSLVRSLSDDEVEAVLAHELSHFKNHDSLVKGLARIARFAFPFDPAIRLIEAAVHRERELLADRQSVKYTSKPLALASALIKAHSGQVDSSPMIGAGLFVGGGGRRWLSLYPNLERRIRLLLVIAQRAELARNMEAVA